MNKRLNIIIGGRHFFDQPIRNDIKTYKNIRKIATDQGDDYGSRSLLDYSYFKENYQLIAADLSKQQGLVVDRKAMQEINVVSIKK